MNITFDVNTEKGDKIVVSLFSYPCLSNVLFSNNEVLEINIERIKGESVILLEVFGKIAKTLINIADNNPDVLFYYFCDTSESIPKQRNNKKGDVYRHELFSLLFERYSKLSEESWIDKPIKLEWEQETYYIHILLRKKHKRFIDILEKEIKDGFKTIINEK